MFIRVKTKTKNNKKKESYNKNLKQHFNVDKFFYLLVIINLKKFLYMFFPFRLLSTAVKD